MWLMTSTLLVGLLTLIFVTWLLDYIKRWRMPPGPFPWPIVGNLSLFSGKYYLTLTDLAKQYGDIVSLKMGMTDVVILNSLDAIREAFVEKSVEFAGRPQTLSTDIRSEGGKAMGNADYNPTWKLQRKLFMSGIRKYASGTTLEALVHDSVHDVITDLAVMDGEAVDLEKYIFKMAFNILGPVVVGARYDLKDEDFQTLMKFSKDQVEDHVFILADIYPLLGFLPSKGKTKLHKQIDSFFDVFKRQVDKHRLELDPDNLRDMTDMLIIAQKDAKERGSQDINSLTDTHIKYLLADVFGGGTDATIQVLRWAFLYLAAHPEIQEKLAAELDSVVGRDRLPGLTDRGLTNYLEATVYEVLRMGILDPLSLPHTAIVNTTLRGYQIPKGTVVRPNFWAVHHDPAIWNDPHIFRPERFLDENGKIISKPSALMTFSVGRRACPGETTGMAETYLMLGALIQNFRFRIPTEERPPDLCSDERGGIFRKSSPYRVVLARRN